MDIPWLLALLAFFGGCGLTLRLLDSLHEDQST